MGMFDKDLVEYYISGLSTKYSIDISTDNRLKIIVTPDKKISPKITPFNFNVELIMKVIEGKDNTDYILESFKEIVTPLLTTSKHLDKNLMNKLIKEVTINLSLNVDIATSGGYKYQLKITKKRDKQVFYAFTILNSASEKIVQYYITPSLLRNKEWKALLRLSRLLTLTSIMGDNFRSASFGDEIFKRVSGQAKREVLSECTHVNYIKTIISDEVIPRLVRDIKEQNIKVSKNGFVIVLLDTGDVCFRGLEGVSKAVNLTFSKDVESCGRMSDLISIIC